MQRRDQVVVALLRLVVDRRAPLHHRDQPGRVERLAVARRAPDFFGQRQRGAAVAVGHLDQRRARRRVERQRLADGRFGPRDQLLDRRRVERLEHQHARPRQQRRVELERRVLGRRADQGDRAVLHHRQKRILLGAVEAMDLVDEQQRRAAVAAARARRIEDLLQFGDAGVDRRDLDEFGLGLLADQPRHRRLAGARRAPEDHRAEARRGEHARQRAFRSGQVLLPGDFVEGLRPQPLRQRRRRPERGEEVGIAAQRRPSAAVRPAVAARDAGALPAPRRRTMLGRSIDPPPERRLCTAPPKTQFGLPTAEPEEVGLSRPALARLSEAMAARDCRRSRLRPLDPGRAPRPRSPMPSGSAR